MAKTPELFNDIAGQYDFISAALSLAGIRAWHHRARELLAVEAGHRVLDVGCGTGSVTRWLAADAGPGGEVVGLDPSEGMLAAARRAPTSPSGAPIRWVHGYGESLPFGDATFDRVTAQFSLRNMMDWRQGLREMARVLKPGGRLVILELLQPVTTGGALAMRGLEQVTRLLFVRALRPYRWLGRSLLHAPSTAELTTQLEHLGLKTTVVQHWLGDLVTVVAADRVAEPLAEAPPEPATPVVLWATDGSETALEAGRWIVRHFVPGTVVHVVAVCPPLSDRDAALAPTDRSAWYRDLERSQEVLPPEFPRVTTLLDGEPGPALLHYARTIEPHAIVLGQKRRDAGAVRLMGSLTRYLTAVSPWPVILVPPRYESHPAAKSATATMENRLG